MTIPKNSPEMDDDVVVHITGYEGNMKLTASSIVPPAIVEKLDDEGSPGVLGTLLGVSILFLLLLGRMRMKLRWCKKLAGFRSGCLMLSRRYRAHEVPFAVHCAANQG